MTKVKMKTIGDSLGGSMENTIIKDFICNVSLLLTLSIIYEIRYIIPTRWKKLTPYINGCLISIICVSLMSMPFELTSGLFFDTRTILIGVTAFVFGGISTLIAVCISIAYRISLGGVGIWMGVLTISTSAALGLFWRHLLGKKTKVNHRWLRTYLFGIVVHGFMLASTLVLPWPLALKTLNQLALPVMLIFPIGTVLLSMLLIWQKERNEASIKVAEAEERYKTLFNNSHAVMMIMSPVDGQIFDANPAACDFYCWSLSELRNMEISMISTMPNEEISDLLLQSTNKKKNYFVCKHRKKHGEIVDVEVYCCPINLRGQTLIYSIIHDISSRVEAVNKLRASDNRLRSAQAIAHVGNWEIDLTTNLLWASEESFNIYGIAYDPLYPYLPLTMVQESVNDAHRPVLDKALHALLANNEKYDIEFSITRIDGETRHIHSMAKLEYDEEGLPRKVMGVIQDITDRKSSEMALSISEAKHKAMIANISDVIAIMGTDGIIKYNSPNIEKWYGWNQNDLVGTSGWDIVHTEDQLKLKIQFSELLSSENKTNFAQFRYKCKDGSYRVVELTATNMASDPTIGGVLMNYQDVTERNITQLEYSALLQATMDGFCIVNHSGKFLEVNDAYCNLIGYSRDEILDMSISDFVVSKDNPAIKNHIMKILNTGSDRFEARHRCKNGNVIDVEASCNMINGSFGRICVFLRDVTDRKKHEDEIIYLSYHDSLTGLYNRTFFEEEYKRLNTPRKYPLSVIIGDINGLKLTNDIFGHVEGDKLLVEIAEILRKSCRKEDIVARMGGDEFCILLPNTDSLIAQTICERIYSACEETDVAMDGRSFHPSISLGFATKISGDQSFEGIFKEAEDSMYKRKLLERNSMHSSIVSSIKATMLEKNHETKEHADRLISICKSIGKQLNLGSNLIYELELLAALHDIGKIGIDDRILCSQRKLTEDEWQEMKKHPEIGYRIALASPELVPIAHGILYHHERWDGKGYPQRLKGDKIPLLARIISIADAYDAMISNRPYRKAMKKEEALTEIKINSGQQFDPEIVDIFLKIIS